MTGMTMNNLKKYVVVIQSTDGELVEVFTTDFIAAAQALKNNVEKGLSDATATIVESENFDAWLAARSVEQLMKIPVTEMEVKVGVRALDAEGVQQ